jgi:pyridoxine 5-phosphate synthase
MPNVLRASVDCQRFGAEGITVHPRPDERHIRFQDVREIRPMITTEFNIEGNPSRLLIDLIFEVLPDQVTLVPDAHDAITSNQGWDTITHKGFLKDIISELKSHGIRTSIFVGTDPVMIEHAAETGTDRVELYTEPYANQFPVDPETAVKPFVLAAQIASQVGLGLNAGHDLNLQNLKYFNDHIPDLLEVSIGHALISDALYYGLENTIQMYLRQLKK